MRISRAPAGGSDAAPDRELNRVLEHLTEHDVRTLTSSPPTLEELFLRHYGEEIATLEVDLAGAR
jgi:hypothetical protein